MAAAPAADPLPFALEPGDPPNPSGPFPGVFTAAQLPERFTSDGPRRMFFDAAGAPAPQTRRSRTSPPPTASPPRCRTSSSSSAPRRRRRTRPAIAALVRSGNPTATVADVREAFDGHRARPRARRASTRAPATASCAPTRSSSTPARRRSRSSGPAADGHHRDRRRRLPRAGGDRDAARAGDQRRRRDGDRHQRRS